jgi:hypothetical protein
MTLKYNELCANHEKEHFVAVNATAMIMEMHVPVADPLFSEKTQSKSERLLAVDVAQ